MDPLSTGNTDPLSNYSLKGQKVSSLELKCLLVSRGVKCDKAVYKELGQDYRLNINPLTCNCLILSDGTICQMTDVGFHLQYLNGALSWDNLKLLRYASELGTPFAVKLLEGKAALFYEGEVLDFVSFAPASSFYDKKTRSGLPVLGNAVLQGLDWVAFQCMWPCQYAMAGSACQFCFSGAEFETRARKKKPQAKALEAADVEEITRLAKEGDKVRGLQITGGSTFDGRMEADLVSAYLPRLASLGLEEMLLYLTPPDDQKLIDHYFDLGASRIAYSLEVWDMDRAASITPGKIKFAGRQAYLSSLEYISEKYGPNRAFSNFIIGLEAFESLSQGALHLAQRGIIPSASVWMPMGRPVMGSMKAPDLDYYRRVIDFLAELYQRYDLEPAGFRGLNVCIEADIKRFSLQ